MKVTKVFPSENIIDNNSFITFKVTHFGRKIPPSILHTLTMVLLVDGKEVISMPPHSNKIRYCGERSTLTIEIPFNDLFNGMEIVKTKLVFYGNDCTPISVIPITFKEDENKILDRKKASKHKSKRDFQQNAKDGLFNQF